MVQGIRIFPGGSDSKSVCLQCRRPGFNPWVGKIPWRRKWHPTPVFLPGKFHGRRSLAGYVQSMGLQKQMRLSTAARCSTLAQNGGLLRVRSHVHCHSNDRLWSPPVFDFHCSLFSVSPCLSCPPGSGLQHTSQIPAFPAQASPL